MKSAELKIDLRLIRYELSHRMEDAILLEDCKGGGSASVDFAVTRWSATVAMCDARDPVSTTIAANVTAQSDCPEPVAAALRVTVDGWSSDHYVLMPAAAYAGNRFAVQASIRAFRCDAIGSRMPVTITNVPRLELGQGPSEIQLKTGDFATPAIAVFDPGRGRGFILACNQASRVGDFAWSLRESDDRSSAEIELRAPGVRERILYNNRVSGDRGVRLKSGESIDLEMRVHEFDCESVQALHNRFFEIWTRWTTVASAVAQCSFSHAWDTLESKYLRQNWVEEYGYFSVGMREVPSQDWQTGWVGGCNSLYPLIAEGNGPTRAKALRTFDFLFEEAQAASGLFRGTFSGGEWHDKGLTLARYSTDGLYFVLKSFLFLEQVGEGGAIKPSWRAGAVRLAKALAKLWSKENQLGQRVDVEAGKVVMGESANAGLAIGGLAIASEMFGRPDWCELARALAEHYYEHYVVPGVITGGPGDMLMCPDSESTAALIESFVALWEVSGDERHLRMAADTARQFASWVVPYDFVFPPQSTFARLDMRTAGTVCANVQNKHSAPGICSLSGVALLKLYRATGEEGFLRMIQLIAHAIPQYMSRADRPLTDRRPRQRWPVMDPGWINERVNMSDWEERREPDEEIRVGEIFGGSTWSEVAMLLTATEVPGIYCELDKQRVTVLDHVEAEWIGEKGAARIQIKNPTRFPARVKILAESDADRLAAIGPLVGQFLPVIEIAPGEEVIHALGNEQPLQLE